VTGARSTTAVAGTLGTAVRVIGETGSITTGVGMTGAFETLAVVESETGADCTTGPATLRHPLVSGAGVALAPVFVAAIPRRPVEVTEAAGVENATTGAVLSVDIVALGIVRLRRRDCIRVVATGTACPVGSSSTLVGQ
jgi:hypothetical protein